MAITWMDLKDARALRGWTQAKLAETLGVHPKTIVNWESTGVPPKSEYKVRRVLDKELRYMEYCDQASGWDGPIDSFEEWEARELRESRRLGASDPEYIPTEDELAADAERLDRAQKAYRLRSQQIKALEPFTSVQLLDEVSRRIQSMEADARVNLATHSKLAQQMLERIEEDVPGSADDAKSDYDLVARKRARDRGEDVE